MFHWSWGILAKWVLGNASRKNSSWQPGKGVTDFKFSGMVSYCWCNQHHWLGAGGGTGNWRWGREGSDRQGKWLIHMRSEVTKNDGMELRWRREWVKRDKLGQNIRIRRRCSGWFSLMVQASDGRECYIANPLPSGPVVYGV